MDYDSLCHMQKDSCQHEKNITKVGFNLTLYNLKLHRMLLKKIFQCILPNFFYSFNLHYNLLVKWLIIPFLNIYELGRVARQFLVGVLTLHYNFPLPFPTFPFPSLPYFPISFPSLLSHFLSLFLVILLLYPPGRWTGVNDCINPAGIIKTLLLNLIKLVW